MALIFLLCIGYIYFSGDELVTKGCIPGWLYTSSKIITWSVLGLIIIVFIIAYIAGPY